MSGAILWFTGMSGAGKSTLATAVGAHVSRHRPVEILDGDAVRTHLSKGLGFSREDRDTNVRRIGFVARLLAKHGVFVIAAAISPYADIRDEVRAMAEADGVAFLEVFVNPTLDSLIARDVKGLYKRALAGEIAHFTGITDPYEVPTAPDLEIQTDAESVEQSALRIVTLLNNRGLVESK
jgi:adenylyl-sulfate kinase